MGRHGHVWFCTDCGHLGSTHRGNSKDPYRCVDCGCEVAPAEVEEIIRPLCEVGGDCGSTTRPWALPAA